MGAAEGILGQGYWKSVKEKQDQYAATCTGKWALNAVRPSIFRSAKGRVPRQLRSTAYLDGLRGFAALLVYLGHHQLWAHESIQSERIFENAFGYEKQYYFATLPVVRTFFSGGHFAVSVFFVLSGYALSYKPLQLIQFGDHGKLGDNLSSALFRRWIRLFIPVICTTFVYMLSWHMGVKTDRELQPTLREETWKWYKEFRRYSFIYDTNGTPGLYYNFHVWSIPTEFKGSIAVFTALMGFSRATRNARLLCSIGLMVYFLYIVDGWYCAMFMMGMFQCDLDLLAKNDNLPKRLTQLGRMQQPLFYASFAVGVLLGGCPASSADIGVLRESPGWHYLAFLKSESIYDFKWFYLFFASSMTVASIPRIPILRRFFELRFNLYLGRISYAFYLVHGPVLWTVADRLYAAAGCTRASHGVTAAQWINMAPIPNFGLPLGLEPNFLLPHLLILPITLWLGEMATKLFDEPSVRLAQWLYQRTLVDQLNA